MFGKHLRWKFWEIGWYQTNHWKQLTGRLMLILYITLFLLSFLTNMNRKKWVEHICHLSYLRLYLFMTDYLIWRFLSRVRIFIWGLVFLYLSFFRFVSHLAHVFHSFILCSFFYLFSEIVDCCVHVLIDWYRFIRFCIFVTFTSVFYILILGESMFDGFLKKMSLRPHCGRGCTYTYS